MGYRNTNYAYGSVARFFHWTIFFLVLIMVTLGFVMINIEDKVFRAEVVNAHKVLGIFVLALVLLRLLWAIDNIKPQLPLGTTDLERFAERVVHYLLYLGLIIMPLSGWLGSVWGGRLPHIDGFQFNLPVTPNKELAGFAFQYVHVPLAYILLFLVSIHVIAAFYHHFVKRDNVLKRMLFDKTDSSS